MGNASRIGWSASALAATLLIGPTLHAETVADFYRGKTVRVVIGYGPGGGYDIYGRLAAQFLGRHIPGNPVLVPVNMPGNSSLRAVDYLYNVAPKDGTYLGSVQQSLSLTAIVDDGIKFDLTKLPYIGRLVSNIDVAVALPRSGITSFEDLQKREVSVGTDQSGSMSVAYAHVLNAYAGAKLKIIKGYSGSAEVQLAVERGEVDVNGSYSLPAVLLSHPDWVRDRTATILYQNAFHRFSQIPHVSTLLDLVKGEEGQKIAHVIAGTAEIGRSILTTPGVPADRLAALRTAFQTMLKDPEFLEACRSRNLMLDPGSWEEMDAINREAMGLSPQTADALRRVLKN
jgi:tripartite-type tricarboxylate transporter receptor subunit TctC